MKEISSKEDLKILIQLTNCLFKTSHEVFCASDLNEEILELNTSICKFLFEIRKFNNEIQTEMNIQNMSNNIFNEYQSKIINKYYNELDILNEKIYHYIKVYKLSNVFKKFQRINTHTLVNDEDTLSIHNLII